MSLMLLLALAGCLLFAGVAVVAVVLVVVLSRLRPRSYDLAAPGREEDKASEGE
jgi:hypothetical protein